MDQVQMWDIIQRVRCAIGVLRADPEITLSEVLAQDVEIERLVREVGGDIYGALQRLERELAESQSL